MVSSEMSRPGHLEGGSSVDEVQSMAHTSDVVEMEKLMMTISTNERKKKGTTINQSRDRISILHITLSNFDQIVSALKSSCTYYQ